MHVGLRCGHPRSRPRHRPDKQNAPRCRAAGLRLGALPADEMLALGRDPAFAVRTRQHDPALGALLVLLPGPTLLGADRAFHVDPLAAAVGSGPRFQLRDLVALAAG